ncbi:uncharacterized protein LOC126846982 [Adelges cooleyi]|uniref:uncharacterized protein LOC126846982 n=1 Tax=Adelges cooleyi TaxID=133065 RepID=UPI00217F311C|nr:uncharacterized protein LOC126846982 [Adelges cooleyi]
MDTSPKALYDAKNIDEEVIKLRSELSRTRSALTSQVFERHQAVAELSLKVDRKNGELKECRQSSFHDLGKVLRSLYVFESRLRREQQQIRRQLGERDAVIRQQQTEIAKLKQTLARTYCCCKNEVRDDGETAVTSKPDLISSIWPQPNGGEPPPTTTTKNNDAIDSSNVERQTVVLLPGTAKLEGPKKNNAAVDTGGGPTKKPTKNNINFNKNVYSKTVTDLSLNDISSFPNPTPNNNLFVVSNSVFSKNEFTYNDIPKEVITPVKQNGKIITSALKKADKFPCPKTVHFGKTTHIPEPDDDGQTDIVKTVETLLLQCGDSTTESENDTSSTASTETSPSVSQMVRKFESICTTTTTTTAAVDEADVKGLAVNGASTRSYIAETALKAAAELRTDSDTGHHPYSAPLLAVAGGGDTSAGSLGDLDPRNNFEEFRFEDCDLDKEYGRPEAEGVENPKGSASAAQSVLAVDNNCRHNDGRVNYESFLEVTGLSQKSIITVQLPSNRDVYGSHRHVQKPKDVKSRSRAKSASFECKPSTLSFPSTVKYWTEPYL